MKKWNILTSVNANHHKSENDFEQLNDIPQEVALIMINRIPEMMRIRFNHRTKKDPKLIGFIHRDQENIPTLCLIIHKNRTYGVLRVNPFQ